MLAQLPPAGPAYCERAARRRDGDLPLWHGPRGAAILKTRFAVELFVGTARMAKALANHGVTSQSWEISRGPGNDFMVRSHRQSLLDAVRAGHIVMIWAGLPCGTWSRARRNDGKGPPPLRSDEFINGLPGLTGKNLANTLEANAMLKELGKLLRECVRTKDSLCDREPRVEPIVVDRRGGRAHKVWGEVWFVRCLPVLGTLAEAHRASHLHGRHPG